MRGAAGILRAHPRALAAAAAAAAAVAALAALAVVSLYARGGGPLPAPLRFLSPADAPAHDSPSVTALRTLRLAGYDHAVVGEEDGTVVVRLSVPSVASPADVELSWQTALAVGAAAYPEAERCAAQVFSGGQALVEVRADGGEVREAPDAAALRARAEIAYLPESGGE
ncbi:MAG: hypothetical protein IBX62_02440 [Coriobacteriia bacterium]|nr:hypothetical protein [Coriobacteriia bacterium]